MHAADETYQTLTATRAELRQAYRDVEKWRKRHASLGHALAFAAGVIVVEAAGIAYLAVTR